MCRDIIRILQLLGDANSIPTHLNMPWQFDSFGFIS